MTTARSNKKCNCDYQRKRADTAAERLRKSLIELRKQEVWAALLIDRLYKAVPGPAIVEEVEALRIQANTSKGIGES